MWSEHDTMDRPTKFMPPDKQYMPKRDLTATQLRFASTHPGWGEPEPIRFKSDGAKT